MNESILNSVKKLLGLDSGYDAFDTDIIVHINTFLGVLNELGIGEKGFSISGPEATWAMFLTDSEVSLNEVMTYVYLRVRMVFDPPTSSVLSLALNETIKELEWRIREKGDKTFEEVS